MSSSSSSNPTKNKAAPVMKYTKSSSIAADEKGDNWDAGSVAGFPWLWIGSLSAVSDVEKLQRYQIRHILTVADRLPLDFLPEHVHHTTVPIADHPQANFLGTASAACCDILDHVAAENANINKKGGDDTTTTDTHNDESSSDHAGVLVHCASGVSRSVTAVLVWLLTRGHCDTLEAAMQAVRTGRPLAQPNGGFLAQLRLLERHGGNLDKAVEEYDSAEDTQQAAGISSHLRRVANDLHEQVDVLEVDVQAAKATNTVPSSLSSFLARAGQLCTRLDEIEADMAKQPFVLPQGQVAKMVLKSARNKLERLIDLMQQQQEQQQEQKEKTDSSATST